MSDDKCKKWRPLPGVFARIATTYLLQPNTCEPGEANREIVGITDETTDYYAEDNGENSDGEDLFIIYECVREDEP
jgi:hypothetical protein